MVSAHPEKGRRHIIKINNLIACTLAVFAKEKFESPKPFDKQPGALQGAACPRYGVQPHVAKRDPFTSSRRWLQIAFAVILQHMGTYKKKTELLDSKEAKRRHDLMDKAIFDFAGSLDELEGALGMYMIGRHFGWKVLYVIHSKKTIRKYEEILGIAVRTEFPEEGPDARRSNGFRAVELATNFWKTITSGQIPDKRIAEKAN